MSAPPDRRIADAGPARTSQADGAQADGAQADGAQADGAQAPAWLRAIHPDPRRHHWSSDGHAWIRFRGYAFMRYPPNDVAPATARELRELFWRVRAPMLSHHRLAEPGEAANAYLYLCRAPGFDLSALSANNRSKVRRALKRLVVRPATNEEMARSGYASYADSNARNGLACEAPDAFSARWRGRRPRPFEEVWGAFAGDEIAAFGIVRHCGDWVELLATKSSNAHLRDYPNHALFYTLLHDLMARPGVRSVSYGLSSVQAESRAQSLHEFKVSVGLEALPVVRRIELHPLLRPAVNRWTVAAARLAAARFPTVGRVRAAHGALELAAGTARAPLAASGAPLAGAADDAAVDA